MTADNTDELTPEDWSAIVEWWRRSQHPDTYYVQPKIKNRPPRGSFTLPDFAVKALGGGDPETAGHVIHSMFGLAPFTDGDPRQIDPDVVLNIGHGSLAAGHKVLRKFCAKLRRQSREGVTLVHNGSRQDDHGWRVVRR